MKLTLGERIGSSINSIFLGLFAIAAMLPFIHVAAQSLSSHHAIVSGMVTLWPVEFSFDAYREVLNENAFWRAFQISVLRTVAGTGVSILLICLLAYPLSRSYIKGRSAILFLIVFTMLFQGGMIPKYLVVKATGLLDTFWAYIIPNAIGAFSVIILKNFFQSVPQELEESARIDGASNVGILFRIMIPLSMPAIATLCLWSAVGNWNAFFDAVLYVTNRHLHPLQVYLRELIMFNQSNMNTNGPSSLDNSLLALESLKAAALMASTIPILILYPFLQKHFVKGIMIGSVKG
ncbi:carbohydrate ABC transporter permease [Paenibacillus sp. YN15]|uniref:carbohydrate ABC transporter permease n=1 Tax=Paenibacillus sp. YN15 TaxID=1742774 RepID=UPI000DCBA805|nr:carbohydrate ABC transporter permease [Paenibacillus sp. YN15]RAV04611.1 ABC transporter permease [Paenibacillus sp. YN15]